MKLIFTLLFTSTLVCFSRAQSDSFVGCYTSGSVTAPGTGLLNPGNMGTTEDNAGACSSYCKGRYQTAPNQPTYSIFGSYGNGMNARNCRCSRSSPAYSGVQSSISTANPTTCSSSSNFAVTRIATSFQFDKCYSGVPGSSTTAASAADADDCFATCSQATPTMPSKDQIFGFIPNAGGGMSRCYCFLNTVNGNGDVCSASKVFAYTRKAQAVASKAYRRNERLERVRRALEEKKKLCPGRLVGCVIPGTESYECLDPQVELESCGGCVHGLFGSSNSSQSFGVNCDALPGAPRGTTTCLAGKCVARACKKGWTLSREGQCELLAI